MRILGKILGWVATLLLVLLATAFVFAEELLKQWLGDVLELPDWVSWLIIGAMVVFLGGVVGMAIFGPKNRAARHEARERRRKLENFDLE